jgi:hypothetical protein
MTGVDVTVGTIVGVIVGVIDGIALVATDVGLASAVGIVVAEACGTGVTGPQPTKLNITMQTANKLNEE